MDRQTDGQTAQVHLPEALPCSDSREVSRIQVIQVTRCRASMVSVVATEGCSFFINPQIC